MRKLNRNMDTVNQGLKAWFMSRRESLGTLSLLTLRRRGCTAKDATPQWNDYFTQNGLTVQERATNL